MVLMLLIRYTVDVGGIGIGEIRKEGGGWVLWMGVMAECGGMMDRSRWGGWEWIRRDCVVIPSCETSHWS